MILSLRSGGTLSDERFAMERLLLVENYCQSRTCVESAIFSASSEALLKLKNEKNFLLVLFSYNFVSIQKM